MRFYENSDFISLMNQSYYRDFDIDDFSTSPFYPLQYVSNHSRTNLKNISIYRLSPMLIYESVTPNTGMIVYTISKRGREHALYDYDGITFDLHYFGMYSKQIKHPIIIIRNRRNYE